MKQFVISKNDEGLRFNKYLTKLLPNAGSGFIFKMLRKKNITLNDSKAEGNETLHAGDSVKIFFSDETFDKFRGNADSSVPVFSKHSVSIKDIVYEDENLIVAFKPAGILSQKDTEEAESMNEMLLTYMVENGSLTNDILKTYKPSICNRLDRNTPGLILFSKTGRTGRVLNRMLKERSIDKYYFAVVNGIMPSFIDSTLYLTKDEAENKVRISEAPINSESVSVHTDFTPVAHNTDLTLVRVKLYTGKSHQIRSVLAYLGFPILGDPKYIPEGSRYSMRNTYYRNLYHIHGQQLLAYAYYFPKECEEPLTALKDRVFCAPVPLTFADVVSNEFCNKGDIYAVMEIPRS